MGVRSHLCQHLIFTKLLWWDGIASEEIQKIKSVDFLKLLSKIFEKITEIQIIPKKRPRNNQVFIRDILS